MESSLDREEEGDGEHGSKCHDEKYSSELHTKEPATPGSDQTFLTVH